MAFSERDQEIVQLFGLYQLKLYFGSNGKELNLLAGTTVESLSAATVVVSIKANAFTVVEECISTNLKTPLAHY